MANKPVVAVVGATGWQGGSLVQAMLADPQCPFTVRALTRDPDSEKGKALAARGAEVVAADLDDPASVRRAFEGAEAAYCVTFYWEHFDPDREKAQAKAMAEAAGHAGLKHVIWSTLEDTRELLPIESDRMPTLKGKYNVPHFDCKAEADVYFRESGVPTTYYWLSFYWDNFIFFGAGPKRGEDGKLAIYFPLADQPMAGIAASDIGPCAYGILKSRDEFVNRTVGVAGELVTGEEMAAGLTDALGEEVRYVDMDADAYRALGFPGADDVGNMHQIYRDFPDHFRKTRDIELARRLNPKLKNYRQWLAENAKKIPLD